MIELRVRAAIVPRRHVSLHFLGDEGVLFDAAAQRLYAVNTTATCVWCCLEEEMSPARIAERLNDAFGLAKSEAMSYVTDIVARWRELRLVSDSQSFYELPPHSAKSQTALTHPPRKSRPRLRAAAERDVRLLDTNFRIRFFSESLLTSTAPFLKSLAAPQRAEDAVALDLVLERENYALYADGRRVGHADRIDQVVPMLKASLACLALERSDDFCAIHAAAVARDGRCILLPGSPGNGKSTLAAAMVGAGMRLLGDDTVVLGRDALAARPVPFSICLKSGSWDLLARRFPDLVRQPIHERRDGKRVRYLMPPPEGICTDPSAQHSVRAVVFPNRRPGAAGALHPIARTEALSRLFKFFHPLAEGLDSAKLERLLGWITVVDCYELQFSALDDATRLLGGLCP